MLPQPGVLRRCSEVCAPRQRMKGEQPFLTPHPQPVNLYYFLLLAVSSNKLRLITRPPARTQTCLLFENSLLYYINQ